MMEIPTKVNGTMEWYDFCNIFNSKRDMERGKLTTRTAQSMMVLGLKIERMDKEE